MLKTRRTSRLKSNWYSSKSNYLNQPKRNWHLSKRKRKKSRQIWKYNKICIQSLKKNLRKKQRKRQFFRNYWITKRKWHLPSRKKSLRCKLIYREPQMERSLKKREVRSLPIRWRNRLSFKRKRRNQIKKCLKNKLKRLNLNSMPSKINWWKKLNRNNKRWLRKSSQSRSRKCKNKSKKRDFWE